VTVVRSGLRTNRRLTWGRFGSGAAYAVGQFVVEAVAGVVEAAGKDVTVDVLAGPVKEADAEAWVGPAGDE